LLLISISSMVQHRCPSSSNHISRSTASHASGCINASIPLSVCIELVFSESFASEKKNRTTFWTKSILVWIARDRSYSRYSEVKLVWQLVPEFFHKWVYVRTNAAVRVATDSIRLGDSSYFFNWVKVSKWIFWS
jgi:hypothetical protein